MSEHALMAPHVCDGKPRESCEGCRDEHWQKTYIAYMTWKPAPTPLWEQQAT